METNKRRFTSWAEDFALDESEGTQQFNWSQTEHSREQIIQKLKSLDKRSLPVVSAIMAVYIAENYETELESFYSTLEKIFE